MMPEAPRVIDLVVTGATEILTCAAGASDLVGRTSGAVAIDADRIVAVGDLTGYTGRREIDAAGGVVLPGFVDAHTHVVFGDSRVEEYAAQVAGTPVPQGAPVGIVGTTARTRALGVEALVAQASARVREMIAHGTTTMESKSGYGLEPTTECRILSASNELNDIMDVDVVTTYLGAHAVPAGTSTGAYVDQVVRQIPEIAGSGLAQFCDVYCDEGYFDLDQTRRILEAGLSSGLPPKLHLDAYSHTGAADLAIELGATSVDHLNFTEDAEVERLAAAGIPGVYMPCLDYAVAHPRPVQARRLAELGMEVALATDVCPGCWTTSMQLVIAMACRGGGLSVAQAVSGATLVAAKSLGRDHEVGSLEPGKQADLLVLDVPGYEHLAYRLGGNSVRTVIKAGQVVVGTDQ